MTLQAPSHRLHLGTIYCKGIVMYTKKINLSLKWSYWKKYIQLQIWVVSNICLEYEFAETVGLLFYFVLMFLVLSKNKLQIKNNSSCAIPCTSTVSFSKPSRVILPWSHLLWFRMLVLTESWASGRRKNVSLTMILLEDLELAYFT